MAWLVAVVSDDRGLKVLIIAVAVVVGVVVFAVLVWSLGFVPAVIAGLSMAVATAFLAAALVTRAVDES